MDRSLGRVRPRAEAEVEAEAEAEAPRRIRRRRGGGGQRGKRRLGLARQTACVVFVWVSFFVCVDLFMYGLVDCF